MLVGTVLSLPTLISQLSLCLFFFFFFPADIWIIKGSAACRPVRLSCSPVLSSSFLYIAALACDLVRPASLPPSVPLSLSRGKSSLSTWLLRLCRPSYFLLPPASLTVCSDRGCCSPDLIYIIATTLHPTSPPDFYSPSLQPASPTTPRIHPFLRASSLSRLFRCPLSACRPRCSYYCLFSAQKSENKGKSQPWFRWPERRPWQ